MTVLRTFGATILDEWHWVEPLLSKACDHVLESQFTTGHWLADILAGKAYIISDEENSVVLLLYPHRDTLHLEAWAGSGIEQWFDEGIRTIKEQAAEFGVQYITSRSRPGAAKVLQKVGFQIQDYYMKYEV
jgi:hypothetical protein